MNKIINFTRQVRYFHIKPKSLSLEEIKNVEPEKHLKEIKKHLDRIDNEIRVSYVLSGTILGGLIGPFIIISIKEII